MKIPAIGELILKNLKKDRYAKLLELVPDFKKEKTQKYTTVILTLLASIILGIFAVSPTLSTIVTLQKQLNDAKFVEQKLEEKINNLSSLQQKYENLKADLPVVYSAIPKTSQISELLAEVQGLGQQAGVKITNFQTLPVGVSDDTVLNKKFSSFDFDISVQGDYQNMAKFLDGLSSFQRIVTINNVSIAKTVGVNTSILQLSIKGTSYFKK